MKKEKFNKMKKVKFILVLIFTFCLLLLTFSFFASAATVSSYDWTNLRNGSSINFRYQGDSVLMRVAGININSPNYLLAKRTSQSPDVWSPLNWITVSLLNSPSLGISSWRTNDTGYFYFTIRDDIALKPGVGLTVYNTNPGYNDLPVAKIDYPPAADYINNPLTANYRFAVNNFISFNQSSYDEDDLLGVTWYTGDVNYSSRYNSTYLRPNNWTNLSNIHEYVWSYGNGWAYHARKYWDYALAANPLSANTLYKYTIGGKWYRIILMVNESSRSNVAVDSREIYVFKEGINVVPIIISPLAGSTNSGTVLFNGSASYVVNCTSGTMAAPNFTLEGNLKCKYLSIGSSVVANWVLDNSVIASGNWNIGSNQGFNRTISVSGVHNIKLVLNYISSGGAIERAEKDVNFSVLNWACSNNATSALWTKQGSSNEDAINSCSRVGLSCCPTSGATTCGANGVCSSPSQLYCANFNTSASCGGVDENSDIAIRSVGNAALCPRPSPPALCDSVSRCICGWNSTTSTCSAGYSRVNTCPPNDPPVSQGECFFTVQKEDRCNMTESIIIIRSVADWRTSPPPANKPRDADCVTSQRSLPCASTTRLPFFNPFGFVISICAVVFIYAIFLRKFRK